MNLFNPDMQREKIAIISLALIIIIVLSAFITITYGDQILKNIFGKDNKGEINPGIEYGDCADVYYIGRFTNGTIFDTNIKEVAIQAGIYSEEKEEYGFYDLAKVFVDPDFLYYPPGGYENYSQEDYTIGFLNGLIGVLEGQIKNVTISPEDGYGTWNESLAELLGMGSYPLEDVVVENNISQNLSEFLMYFEDINLSVNTTFDYGAVAFEQEGILNATIVNITNENITYMLFPKNGTVFKFPIFNWNATIIVENNTAFTLHFSVEVGHIFSIDSMYGPTHFKVMDINETSAKLALNLGAPKAYYIDQIIIFQLEAVQIYKTSLELELES